MIAPGLRHELRYRVPANKTVPALYPEAAEFGRMPEVFATGFLVGLLEWACMRAIEAQLAPGQQTLGTHIEVSHRAPTPPGVELRVSVHLMEVEGRRLLFEVEAHDGIEVVSAGRHERHLIDRARFDANLARRWAPLQQHPHGASR